MARQPLGALALVGLGIRRLSMTAASIGPKKETLMAALCGEVMDFIRTILNSGETGVRSILADYTRNHGISI